ncbi:unnamed protein product [Rotaria sordida]|uniref:Adenylate kinase n=2 Tax=Rotaria sordida TaxID=392033 RepID=A0A815AGW9_9BILA|nr:unnamed protein product [Rotaria sordida]
MSKAQTNENTGLAMDYLSQRNIPQLFEALMTGLIINRPDDHIEYLMKSLEKYKNKNNKQPLAWNAFVERENGLDNTSTSKTKRQLKPDSIPQSKREEKPKIQDRPRSSKSSEDIKNILQGKPIIFVGGGPGSGKRTQCEKMVAKYGFTHLSAGDLIREVTQDSSTEKGRYFNEAMSQGKLISTEDILGLLKDAIYKNANKASGFLINGFPRRVEQGIQFEQDVARCDFLIYFDVSDEIMTERLVKRGETSDRIDDNEEAVQKRLVTFHQETQPILGYYGKQGKLITIDTNRKPDEIFEDVSYELGKIVKQQPVVRPRDPALDKLKNKKIIFVVGGPGSGKGTQCERIVQRYGYTHLSTGYEYTKCHKIAANLFKTEMAENLSIKPYKI